MHKSCNTPQHLNRKHDSRSLKAVELCHSQLLLLPILGTIPAIRNKKKMIQNYMPWDIELHAGA